MASIKRPVIVDGCNVIHLLGHQTFDILHMNRRKPNACCLLLLVHELLASDFQVHVVLKEFFDDPHTVENHFIIEYLRQVGLIEIVPDHGVDDDELMLQQAEASGAVVITNDKFAEAKYARYAARERVLRLTFHRVEGFRAQDAATQRDQRFNFNLQIRLESEVPQCYMIAPDDRQFVEVQQLHDELAARRGRYRAHTELIADFLQQRRAYLLGVNPPRLPFFNPRFTRSDSFLVFLREYERYLRRQANGVQG